ncbi:helix-turn-helix transcriptional regulator [Fodinicola feengrottensis]
MDKRTELGEFLRSRRAALSPEDIGLASFGGRRRVAGLRREELAQVAGVSADYYTRLEQGRGRNVSESVLDALAEALRLSEAERAHLRDLARPARARRHSRPQRVRPQVQLMLDSLQGVPAFVLGRRMDILAWNAMACALITDFSQLPPARRNMLRIAFGPDSTARDLYPDWSAVGRDTVGYLRQDAARYPDDPEVLELIGELSLHSADFRRWWAAHPVHSKTHGQKLFDHPLVGEMALSYECFSPNDDPDQVLITYTAEPASASAVALAHLATLVASPASAAAVNWVG